MKDHIEIRDLEHLEDLIEKKELLRRKEIDSLIKWVEKAPAPFVIAVDAPWGTGKTVTMDMLRVQLEDKGYKCVRFNAWECDYATDPLVPMVAEIEELFSKYEKSLTAKGKRLWKKAKKSANKFAGGFSFSISLEKFGIPTSTGASIGFNPAVDVFTKQRKVLENFREELKGAIAELLKENKKVGNNKSPAKLVFFIDELDRCRPTFAIELLERVKHIFDIPNIVFVLSLAKKQLEASIQSVYGAEFDANAYLHRFINLEYGLPNLPSSSFIKMLLKRFGLFHLEDDGFSLHLSSFFDAFELPLREQERCITRLYFSIPIMEDSSPMFMAFLLCMRSTSKGKNTLRQFAEGEKSAEDMINYVKALPKSEKIVADTIGALHAHFLLADPNRARAYLAVKDLEKLPTEENEAQEFSATQKNYKALEGKYSKDRRGKYYLNHILSKIDLTEGIQ